MTVLRRELSLAEAKSYSACLLGRVARVGEQHRQAARRREEESRAHWVANVQRRGFFRGRGNFVTE